MDEGSCPVPQHVLDHEAAELGPLDETTEGRLLTGGAPVMATPVVVGAAAAVVLAYAAGRVAGELRPM
jgi:hypothetical protein